MKFHHQTLLATGLIASCLASNSFAAEAVNADVYGSLRIGVQSTDLGADSDAANGQDFLSRIGVKAQQKLDNGLSVTGQLEYGLEKDFQQKSNPTLRLANVGLKGDFGAVYFGSQTTIWHKFVRGAYFSDGNDSLRQGAIRDDDLLQYYYKNGGFTLAAGVQMEGQDGDDIDQYQLGGEYKSGALKLQLAYSQDNRGDNTGSLLGARAWYTVGDVTFSAFSHQASDDFDLYGGNSSGNTTGESMKPVSSCTSEQRSTNGVYAAYKFGANKIHSRYAINSCEDAGDVDSIKVEYVRSLSKQAKVWVSYEVITLDDDRQAAGEAFNTANAADITAGTKTALLTDEDASAVQLGVRFDF